MHLKIASLAVLLSLISLVDCQPVTGPRSPDPSKGGGIIDLFNPEGTDGQGSGEKGSGSGMTDDPAATDETSNEKEEGGDVAEDTPVTVIGSPMGTTSNPPLNCPLIVDILEVFFSDLRAIPVGTEPDGSRLAFDVRGTFMKKISNVVSEVPKTAVIIEDLKFGPVGKTFTGNNNGDFKFTLYAPADSEPRIRLTAFYCEEACTRLTIPESGEGIFSGCPTARTLPTAPDAPDATTPEIF